MDTSATLPFESHTMITFLWRSRRHTKNCSGKADNNALSWTPINQIADWLRYIHDNRVRLENEQGLVGISVSPRLLIVIGRSSGLTENDRSKIQVLESMHPRLRIRTYDDILADARNFFQKTLGPVSALIATNARVYWYKATQ